MSTQSAQYKDSLYEIHNVKSYKSELSESYECPNAFLRCFYSILSLLKSFFVNSGKYELCEPLVNSYKKGTNTYYFKGTNTVMIVSKDCPVDIMEILSIDELFRIFTEEEMYKMYNISFLSFIET